MPPLIVVATAHANVFVPESAISFTAVRASGAGGQNVNKVSSKVDVRVDLTAIVGLDSPARERLLTLASASLDANGRFRITSQKTRDQGRNLEDAYEKIRQLVLQALVVPRKRRPTKPTRGSVVRRLDEKKQASERKAGRTRREHE